MADLMFRTWYVRGEQIMLYLSNKVFNKTPFYFYCLCDAEVARISCLPHNCANCEISVDRQTMEHDSCSQTHTHTHTHTHRPTTVTLAAHACRGLTQDIVRTMLDSRPCLAFLLHPYSPFHFYTCIYYAWLAHQKYQWYSHIIVQV